ncbi:GntR family transcriptional regulator [Streptomyces iakyrus]|uniref:GntR family transcriptional regulator n=1 Tax=Streptomyces iakyrus TaxID=68219 RepID=UPI0036AFEA84
MSEGYTGEGGGRPFERVAGELRARMASGRYPLHSRLPSQRELADEFGVSRDTVQRVLRELKSEGWIESRQGSGSSVIRTQQIHLPTSGRMVTLGPLISEAFEQPEVTLDVFTLTSESLDAHIRLQADRIGAREIAPQSITLRMLLPDESLDFPYWRTENGADDEILRERFLAITRRHTASLRSLMNDLRTMELVPSVDFEIRKTKLVPAFKLYLINKVAALHGPYQTNKRRIVLEDGQEIEATDVVGLGAQLTHHVQDENPYSTDTVFVTTHQSWFDSAWTHISHDVLG